MTYVKLGIAVAGIALVALVSCAPDKTPILADTDDVDQFAQDVLNSIQPRSIAENREFCGYIYSLPEGGLAATAPAMGGTDFCDMPAPDSSVIASYHTHGGYSDDYDNEVPSVDDMRGDFMDGLDGYFSTPGGRFWQIDYEDQIARQLCPTACMIADPENDPQAAGFVPRTFTLPALEERFE